MKIEPVLQEELSRRLGKTRRRIMFTTVSKLYLGPAPTPGAKTEWIENCGGWFILFKRDNCYGFCILRIADFRVQFEMNLYSNFLDYAKFNGDLKTMHFVAPQLNQDILHCLLVLTSRTEVLELKQTLNQIYVSVEDNDKESNLEFFSQLDVIDIMKRAQINQVLIINDQIFRNQAEQKISEYFTRTKELEKKNQKTGFKAYSIGRTEVTLQKSEIEFKKQKDTEALFAALSQLQRQSKTRNNF